MALKRNRDTGDWEDVPEEEVASQPFLDPDALPPSDIAPAVEPITAEAPLSEPVPEPAPYQDPYQYTDTLPEHRGDRDAGLSEAYPDTPLDLSGGGATLTEDHFDGTEFQSGTVDLRPGSRLDVASGEVVIASGVTLIKDGAFGASDQLATLTIEAGGLVTHARGDTAGLVA